MTTSNDDQAKPDPTEAQRRDGAGLGARNCSDDLIECLAHHEHMATVLLNSAKDNRARIAEMDKEPLLRPAFSCTWEETKLHNLGAASWDEEKGMMHKRFMLAIRSILPNRD